MIYVKWALAMSALLAAGAGVVSALARRRLHVGEFIGLSLILGFGVAGVVSTLVMAAGLSAIPVVPCVLGVTGLAIVVRHPPSLSRWDHPTRAAVLGWGLIALAVIMAFIGAVSSDLMGFDADAFWSMKARSLARYGTFRNPDFLRPDRPHPHPHYPLLVPTIHAWVYLATGSTAGHLIRLTMTLFWVASLGVMFGSLRERIGSDRATLATAIFALTPATLTGDSGGITSGYSDYPLAVFVLLAGLEGRRWLETGSRSSAAIAAIALSAVALVKKEGTAAVLVATMLLAFFSIVAQGRRRLFNALLIALPALLLLGLWAWVIRSFPPNDIPLDYRQADLARLPGIARLLGSQFVRFKEWTLLWGVVLALILSRFPKPSEPASYLAWTGAGILASYVVTWTAMFPASELRQIMFHLTHYVNRITMHLMPIFFAWAAERIVTWQGGGGATEVSGPAQTLSAGT